MSDTSSSNSGGSLLSRLLGFGLLALAVVSCGGPNLVDRMTSPRWGFCGTLVIILDIVALVDLLGDNARTTGNKVLWSLLIVFMPVLGVILYFLFGKD